MIQKITIEQKAIMEARIGLERAKIKRDRLREDFIKELIKGV